MTPFRSIAVISLIFILCALLLLLLLWNQKTFLQVRPRAFDDRLPNEKTPSILSSPITQGQYHKPNEEAYQFSNFIHQESGHFQEETSCGVGTCYPVTPTNGYCLISNNWQTLPWIGCLPSRVCCCQPNYCTGCTCPGVGSTAAPTSPTVSPTVTPTNPTVSPTAAPTNPTVLPTLSPTVSPTVSPTAIPTIVTIGPQSTGVAGAIGSLDLNWLITYTPMGPTTVHPYICTPNSGWLANTANAKWICPSPDENLMLDAPGNYTYETTFTLPVSSYLSVTIPVTYSQDDVVHTITLNGVVLFSGTSGTWNGPPTNFNLVSQYTSKFVLTVTVWNGNSYLNPTGLYWQFGTPVYVTASPSAVPSTFPTTDPTSSPTSLPTLSPTCTPTSTPSKLPTSTPSRLPTSTPSRLPTSTPSRLPTSTPSRLPTSTPTSLPTSTPTSLPTSTPSKLPTTPPNSLPPTVCPSACPSSSPLSSCFPTTVPSFFPSTVTPITAPTTEPSISLAPTQPPSFFPTVKSTSQAPSVTPSTYPSLAPSVSLIPSQSSLQTDSIQVVVSDSHNLIYIVAGGLGICLVICIFAALYYRWYRRKYRIDANLYESYGEFQTMQDHNSWENSTIDDSVTTNRSISGDIELRTRQSSTNGLSRLVKRLTFSRSNFTITEFLSNTSTTLHFKTNSDDSNAQLYIHSTSRDQNITTSSTSSINQTIGHTIISNRYTGSDTTNSDSFDYNGQQSITNGSTSRESPSKDSRIRKKNKQILNSPKQENHEKSRVLTVNSILSSDDDIEDLI